MRASLPARLKVGRFTARRADDSSCYCWEIRRGDKKVGALFRHKRPEDRFGFSLSALVWSGALPPGVSDPRTPYYGWHFDGLGFDSARQAFQSFARSAERLIAWRAENDCVLRVRAHLSDDLRRPPWRGDPRPTAGHCYVASEALRALLGPRYRPATVRHEGAVHWFLRGPHGVVDATADQFSRPPTYAAASGRGFLTREPSRRARILLDRIQGAKP